MLRLCALTTSSVRKKERDQRATYDKEHRVGMRSADVLTTLRRTYASSFVLGGITALSLCLKSTYFATYVRWAH